MNSMPSNTRAQLVPPEINLTTSSFSFSPPQFFFRGFSVVGLVSDGIVVDGDSETVGGDTAGKAGAGYISLYGSGGDGGGLG